MANTKEINDLKKQLTILTSKIDDIQQQVNASVISAVTSAMEKLNKLIDEKASQQVEEKERKRSVVLIGLPESKMATPSARVADDTQRTTAVLDQLGVESSFTIYRMGIRDPARAGSRLCKVVFPSRRFQIQTIKEWSKHREAVRALVGNKFSIRWSESEAERKEKMENWAKKREGGGFNGSNFVNNRRHRDKSATDESSGFNANLS